MDQEVRVYQPETRWLVLVVGLRLRAGDPLRERAFDAVLNGHGARLLSLSEARRLKV